MKFQERNDSFYMSLALNEAKKAYKKNEVPVGCVIVKDNKVIAASHNKKEKKNIILAHAEILAIIKASKKLHTWRLENCILYVTLEPCAMCMAAISQSRVKKIIISSKNNKKLEEYDIIDSITKDYGILESESSQLLKTFFQSLRDK
ncbi:MAG: nucleoside deaminase [Acholeplasmatales bacterium]|nr:nucleoside deaminase [Acholeplasmatales bacterium]